MNDLAFEIIFDVLIDLRQLHFFGRDFFAELEDVITELGRDDVADLVGIHGEGGGFKLRRHLAARESVFAAFVLCARIFRIVLGELGEIFALAGPL